MHDTFLLFQVPDHHTRMAVWNTDFTFLLIRSIQAIQSNILSMKLKCVTSKQSVVTSYLEWKLATLEMAIAYLS